MKQKIFIILLAITACVGILFAESGTCGDNLTWTLEDGVLTISGCGEMWNYTFNGLSQFEPFSDNIKKIVIYEGVTSIGRSAFSECSSLSSITIPYSVTSIGDLAFIDCWGLKSVTIPSSVTSIGYDAFSFCRSLTSVTIPYSVTNIGDYAFNMCTSLTSVTFLNERTRVGNNIFNSCDSLQEILHPKGLDLSRAEIPANTRKIEFVFPESQFKKEESSITCEYVDLDLPSKTLWKKQNEESLESFDQATERFGNKLPTKEQWLELIDECTWIWVEPGKWYYEVQKGSHVYEGDTPFYLIKGQNGNIITLPVEGYLNDNNIIGIGGGPGGLIGSYCSSSKTKDKAFYIMYFDDDSNPYIYESSPEEINNLISIRLVYK